MHPRRNTEKTKNMFTEMSHVDNESYNQQVLLQLDPPIAGVFEGQAAIRVGSSRYPCQRLETHSRHCLCHISVFVISDFYKAELHI